MSSAISKNNKQVAYSNWSPYHTFDLNVVDIDNPSPRILYRQEGVEVYPITWLSDIELIAIRENRRTEIANITLFNVVNSTFHDLKTFNGRIWPHISCSPDEKYIAYDFEKENNGGNFDINILDVAGESEISLVNHPANDRVVGWVPGRKEFLFLSDRSGTWDLWALPVKDGKPSGMVKRVYTDIGDVQPMGLTRSGNCFFGFSRRNFNTYIAPFNAGTGELNEESGKSMLGSNIWVKWSPDGQYLTYINLAENPPPLTIQNLKSGEERKLGDNLLMAMSPCWSPDGNSILVIGRDKSREPKGYKGDIYLVDVKTGQKTEILRLSDYEYDLPDDDAFPLSDLEWSSDGKSIFFLFFKDRLVKHDLKTGEDKIVYKHSHFNRGVLCRSPDGRSLLFAVHNPEEKKSHLLTIPVEGGEEKELCSSQESDDFKWGYWSPDGKYIYFTERPEETNLWRVPAEGGTPDKIWHSKDRTEFFSIHPDGKQIALAKRERTTEIRVIENLVQELEKNDNLSK
jgi:Tol biopolymer transport system component